MSLLVFTTTKSPKALGLQLTLYVNVTDSLLRALTIVQDDGTPDQYDLPPPSKEGAIPASPLPNGKSTMPNDHLHQDDTDRYVEKTGWAPRFGQGSITTEEAEESLLDHTTLLESKLNDKFFGGRSFEC